jgi:hypothetical protein
MRAGGKTAPCALEYLRMSAAREGDVGPGVTGPMTTTAPRKTGNWRETVMPTDCV